MIAEISKAAADAAKEVGRGGSETAKEFPRMFERPDGSETKPMKDIEGLNAAPSAARAEFPNPFERPEKLYEVEAADNSELAKNCPRENGKWEGERGDSKWKPDPDYVPQKANPEGKPWRDILDKHDTDGITFKDGEPDFSDISKGTVEIEDFSDNRSDNFDKADIALAEQRGCSPEEVAEWRKENGYTWHECKDMKTIQKVPCEVHNNIPHSGGISEAKKGADK